MERSRATSLFRAAIGVSLVVAGSAGALAPGKQAPDISVQNLYYEDTVLAPVPAIRVTILFFFSNTCPVARRYMARMSSIHDEYREKGVRIAGINASPADPVLDVAQHALEYHLTFPVYKDADFSAVKALDVTRTPEIVVLDQDFIVRYRGRIDDQYRLGGVLPMARNHDLRNALNQLLAGESVAKPETQAEGCAVTFPMLPEAPGDLTFHKDIEPILREHCIDCHGESGAAPFRLDSYGAVLEQSASISTVLRDRSMPPWFSAGESAVPQEGLSPRERHRMANWLRGDAREGKPTEPAAGSASAALSELQPLAAPEPDPEQTGIYNVPFSLENQVPRWLQSLSILGPLPAGCAIVEVHLAAQGNLEAPRLIAGPIVPGRPLAWDPGTGIRVPPGARINLSIRADGSNEPPSAGAPIRLVVQTSRELPDWEITCLKFEATRPEIGADYRQTVELPDQGTLRAAAVVLDKGYASALTMAESSLLLSVPVYDGDWPLTYRFDREAGAAKEEAPRVDWTVTKAGYLAYPASGRDHPTESLGLKPLVLYLYAAIPGSADH